MQDGLERIDSIDFSNEFIPISHLSIFVLHTTDFMVINIQGTSKCVEVAMTEVFEYVCRAIRWCRIEYRTTFAGMIRIGSRRWC